MTTYDHYAEAKQIAGLIENEGFAQQAGEVRHAIDDGRSGTEIFMQIRYYLSPLLEDERIDSVTRERIRILVEKINEALTR